MLDKSCTTLPVTFIQYLPKTVSSILFLSFVWTIMHIYFSKYHSLSLQSQTSFDVLHDSIRKEHHFHNQVCRKENRLRYCVYLLKCKFLVYIASSFAYIHCISDRPLIRFLHHKVLHVVLTRIPKKGLATYCTVTECFWMISEVTVSCLWCFKSLFKMFYYVISTVKG